MSFVQLRPRGFGTVDGRSEMVAFAITALLMPRRGSCWCSPPWVIELWQRNFDTLTGPQGIGWKAHYMRGTASSGLAHDSGRAGYHNRDGATREIPRSRMAEAYYGRMGLHRGRL